MPTIADVTRFLAQRCAVEVLDAVALDAALAGPASLASAGPLDVAFARAGVRRLVASDVRAAVLVVDESLEPDVAALREAGVRVLARCSNARLEFARLVDALFPVVRPEGVDATAWVSPLARLDDGVRISAGAYVGDARIGARTVIGPGARVLDDVSIGEDCVVYPNAVIGADGFGFERDDDGTPVKFPQRGAVSIGDRVEIGACACVDRGALSDTVIEDDAKVDNLVHVAHNVRVGRGAMIAASAVVGGSSAIGERVWIGPSATVSNGITVGDDASVSLGAVVTRDVEPGKRVTGNFAVPHERFLENLRKNR